MVERLRESTKDVVARIGAMDASARLLVGSIAIILVMGLFLVSQYAASPAMATIRVNPEDKAVAIQTIVGLGYEAEDGGAADLVQVNASNRAAIVGLLENEGYVAAADQDDPLPEQGSMMSQAQRESLQKEVQKREAEKSIRMIRGVDAVNIVFNPGDRTWRVITGARPATASVTVTPKATARFDRAMAERVAMVAANGLGIDLQHVTVVDALNSSSFDFGEEGGGSRRDYFDVTRTWQSKIEGDLLDFVRPVFPQASVAVNVNLLLADIVEVETDPGKPVSGDTFIESDETSTPVRSASGGLPGFSSNCGVAGANSPAALGAAGSANNATRESERRIKDLRFPYSTTTTDELANFPVKVAASLIIPEQDVVRQIRTRLGEDAEIGQDEISARVAEIEKEYLGLLGPLVDSSGFRDGSVGEVNVAVLPYADWISPEELEAAQAVDTGIGATIGSMASGDMGAAVKNAGLVGLALLSLAMMFMMVRRSGNAAPLPTAEELAGVPPVLEDDRTDVVGEADEATPALVGLELDDEDLRRRQMLDQLNQLIKKEPAEVAQLLRRWMRTEA